MEITVTMKLTEGMVYDAMKAALISKVKNIRNIDILIKAFQYRKYYCEV